jgi:hypothetical protein
MLRTFTTRWKRGITVSHRMPPPSPIRKSMTIPSMPSSSRPRPSLFSRSRFPKRPRQNPRSMRPRLIRKCLGRSTSTRLASARGPGPQRPVGGGCHAGGFRPTRRHPGTPCSAPRPETSVGPTSRASGPALADRRGAGAVPGVSTRRTGPTDHAPHPAWVSCGGNICCSPLGRPVGPATEGRSRRLFAGQGRDQPAPGPLGNVGTEFGMVGSPPSDMGFIRGALGAPIWGGGA